MPKILWLNKELDAKIKASSKIPLEIRLKNWAKNYREYRPIYRFQWSDKMKMEREKYFGEQIPFFKGKDIEGNELSIIISGVRELELPSGITPVIDFKYKKEEKSLPLNSTNFGRLIEKHGDESDNWIGKKITLMKVLVTNPQTKKEVESIRIKE